MRYLLIDRIIDYQSGQRIRGVKNVAMSEDFLEYHFPRNPVMPGVLLLEAMVQLAGWLQCASTDFTQWVVVETVHKCRFYGFALPGDQVEIVVDVVADITPEDRKAVFKATGTVLGQKKVSAEFSGVVIPLAEIADRDEQLHQFRLMMRDMGL
ncbi:MAG: beta-hydroxyacyl-ACP dehydratase [Nitrospirae bacterium]|uniref:3-hydroxyacyl-ACP dehydratase FabZ family protein n=1 Tax=Candidatus Magnetobacterium casense TaxID=1455061 RepID=UPI000696B6AC|nr:3-hydroxyacyl-ACP dehydratase FabZ family protein [Candidatus Magnetobacterium casensis]MBF0337774.1 beta-hydroxyacyl-ACP dehydratase [Nitrospirota bacterium]